METDLHLFIGSNVDAQITLWDLPNLKNPTVLTQFKNVQSFGIHNTLQPAGSLIARSNKKKTEPKLTETAKLDVVKPGDISVEEEKVSVSTVVIGCRKRVAAMSWSGGKPLGGTRVRAFNSQDRHSG